MISRTLSKFFLATRRFFPVLALLGPRQSGKTTLAKFLFPDLPYYTLEDHDTRQFALKDPRGFLNSTKEGAIIDEAQNAPKFFSYLQTHVDELGQKGRFILTGSQNLLLHEGITQSLAGRVALATLLPLSLEELHAQPTVGNSPEIPPPRTLYQHVLQGGYPSVVTMPETLHATWFASYTQTYLERDIRLMKNIGDLSKFHDFLILCANRVGQLLNITSLAQDLAIAPQTAKEWLSLLEASYVIFLLRPYHNNYNKRLTKQPKLYFHDTGLACHLIGLRTQAQLQHSYLKGSLVENFMISELLKSRQNRMQTPALYFWRDHAGHEVDCLLEHDTHVYAFEIKASETITDDFFKNIHYWQTVSKHRTAYVVHGGLQEQPHTNVHVLSWKRLADTSFLDFDYEKIAGTSAKSIFT